MENGLIFSKNLIRYCSWPRHHLSINTTFIMWMNLFENDLFMKLWDQSLLSKYVGKLIKLLLLIWTNDELFCSSISIPVNLLRTFLILVQDIVIPLFTSQNFLVNFCSLVFTNIIYITRAGILLSQNLHSRLIPSWKKDWHIIKNEYLITSLKICCH